MNIQEHVRFQRALALLTALVPLWAGCAADEPASGTDEAVSVSSDEEGLSDVQSHAAMATFFDGLGTPYGGCGVPQALLDTPSFVALNVQNTPHDYSSMLPRPIANAAQVGEFKNGRNCGRWVRVTIGNFCTAPNGGAPNEAFCRGGKWVADRYNGATLDLQVADSCQDPNGWCRDDRFHLDLSRSSLGRFAKDGRVISGLESRWNNRQIAWHYIDAPSYSGDIKIGFHQGAKHDWPAIIVTHLKTGIHGVKSLVNGVWKDATMLGDNGQVYQLPISTPPYQIKVLDANDKPIQNGRVYRFGLPSSCANGCSAPYTGVSYSAH